MLLNFNLSKVQTFYAILNITCKWLCKTFIYKQIAYKL